jgi:hypothetical protein
MKVFDLRCADGHGFEGWFASDQDYLRQDEGGLVECPLCGSRNIAKMPSAPRLNLSSARGELAAQSPTDPASVTEPDLQAMWLKAVRHVVENTEDVGSRFAEEARRIHYGEVAARGIRGQATSTERAALADEGVEIMPLPIPRELAGPLN